MNVDIIASWLRALGAAVSARQLYQQDHARVVEAVRSLHAASSTVVGARVSVSIAVLEGRLTVDAESCGTAGPVAARIFQSLASRGYDRVTIHRGVTLGELIPFVTALAGDGRRQTVTLVNSTHLTFSAIASAAGVSGAPKPHSAAPAQHGLVDLWRGIDEHQTVDRQALDGMVGPIVSTVVHERNGALPLSALESHDAYTATHVGNVALLTMAIAEAAGLPDHNLRAIGVAALLHDIGKMKVPPAILNSPERLTGSELTLMREHPEAGARMLMSAPEVPRLAAVVAFEHHLHTGGGGYPAVPVGWRIHPASAMTQVADVYDALRTNRPYRAALEHEEVIEIMSRDSGTVFEPRFLSLFLERVVPRTYVAPGLATTP